MKTACCITLVIVMVAASRARGVHDTVSLGPGKTLELKADLVLSGDDVLEIDGTGDKPCTLIGNDFQIRTAPNWRGHVRIRHCDIRGLGTAKTPALKLSAGGAGDKIVIENCVFDDCGPIHLHNADKSGTVFRNNTILANARVQVTNLPNESPAGFVATGNTPARKLFQGNHIYKSVVLFERTRNWLIGGDTDADSNLLIGVRASLSLFGCADMVIRGNYLHTEIPSYKWSQVHTLAIGADCTGLVTEHNIIRHGQWVVRGVTGQFRYNLVLDADAHNWIIGPRAGTHIHHNIFARYCTVDPNLNAGIGVIYKGDDIQIYNNTFDGGGKDMKRIWHVPAIEVNSEAFLTSLRNNAFYNFPTKFHNGTATIRPGFFEKKTEPGPPRLGYADYNLFYNPDAAERDNYALSVASKTERKDAGFAKHDVPPGGEKDAQADPKFKGPIPREFPFADEDIKSRKVPVSKILAHYREVYSPAPGSPLIDTGDPADGVGSWIGAIGTGANSPHDLFGTWAIEKANK